MEDDDDNPFAALDDEPDEPDEDWPTSGWAISTGQLFGWPSLPATSLLEGEGLQAMALPNGQLVISKVLKDGEIQVLLEAGVPGDDRPLRLAVMAFAGCTLELDPAGGRPNPPAYRLAGASAGPSCRLLDAARMCLQHLGRSLEANDPSSESDSSLAMGLALPMLTDLTDGTVVHHSVPILAYLGRRHGLWPTR